MDFKWVKNKEQYGTGERLYSNGIRLGGYHWDSARSQSDRNNINNWVGYIELPSLTNKAKEIYGSNPEEVKTKIEQIVITWFDKVLAPKSH